jgi:hypothetical protein
MAAGLSHHVWTVGFTLLGLTVVQGLLFLLGGRVRTELLGSDAALAPGNDPNDRTIRELAALGFQPAGATRDTVWLLGLTSWRWRLEPVRWMKSDDGLILARLARGATNGSWHVRLTTLNNGGGSVRTEGPGTVGPSLDPSTNTFRDDLPAADPGPLVAKHRENLAVFHQRQGLEAEPTSLAGVLALDGRSSARHFQLARLTAQQARSRGAKRLDMIVALGGLPLVAIACVLYAKGTGAWSGNIMSVLLMITIVPSTWIQTIRGTRYLRLHPDKLSL